MQCRTTVAVAEEPVYASSSLHRCWRPHHTHMHQIESHLLRQGSNGSQGGETQQDSETNRNPNLHSISGLAVTVITHRSQNDNGFSSLSSEDGIEEISGGEARVSWVQGSYPQAGSGRHLALPRSHHISLRPSCSSNHLWSISSYLIAFGAKPSGSCGVSDLPPLHPTASTLC